MPLRVPGLDFTGFEVLRFCCRPSGPSLKCVRKCNLVPLLYGPLLASIRNVCYTAKNVARRGTGRDKIRLVCSCVESELDPNDSYIDRVESERL